MRTCWAEIKSEIKKINAPFYKIVETINPSNDFRLDLVEYCYGDVISDSKHFFMPSTTGGHHQLSANEFPLSMVFEKNLELFLETATNVIPWRILSPGKILPLTKETHVKGEHNFYPNSVLTLTSGIRNVFALPLYAKSEYYQTLQKNYAIDKNIDPAALLNHHDILTTINKKENTNWRSKLLLFDKSWRDAIKHNKQWLNLRIFLYEEALKLNSCKRNSLFLNYAMREIYKKGAFKYKPYTEDMIKQILYVAVGDLPGFAPAIDNNYLPAELFSEVFINKYKGMNTPVIMHAKVMNGINDKIYLSITHNTSSLSDKKTFKPTDYANEIQKYFNLYIKNFSTNQITKDTIYGELHNRLETIFFSEKGNEAKKIKSSAFLKNHDLRIMALHEKFQAKTPYGVPERSPFLKAMVSLEMLP